MPGDKRALVCPETKEHKTLPTYWPQNAPTRRGASWDYPSDAQKGYSRDQNPLKELSMFARGCERKIPFELVFAVESFLRLDLLEENLHRQLFLR